MDLTSKLNVDTIKSNHKEKFDKIKADMAAAKAKFQAELQESFKEVLKEFFDSYPEVTVIKWVQYTPYWNDGETCEFGVHRPSFSNVSDPNMLDLWGELDIDEDDYEYQTAWVYGYNVYGEYYERAKNTLDFNVRSAMDELSKAITSSDMEDILENMFDDHVMVTVTPSGITVSEYRHD